MHIDLGAESGGEILVCQHYGTRDDKELYTFDYLIRNHYNSDGFMLRHLYEVVKGTASPRTTVDQAYVCEAVGCCAIQSSETAQLVKIAQIVSDDLSGILKGDMQ